MLKAFRSFNRWLKTRYGDTPTIVKGGAPPYRETQQEVSHPTHIVKLIWRMVMEGADNTANSFFKHWKAIFVLVLLVVTALGVNRWYRSIVATVDIWSIEQQKELASAQAEQAKAEASAKAEQAKLQEKKKQELEAKKPRAFYISERYWACVHKVVNCEVDQKGDRNDPTKAVKCDPAYTSSGAGFGTPHCSEGDLVQTTFVLKMNNGPGKLSVPVEDYSKHEIGSWVFLMCNQDGCEPKIVDPPPPAPPTSAAPAASSTPPPQPSAAAPTLDPRGANRFSFVSR